MKSRCLPHGRDVDFTTGFWISPGKYKISVLALASFLEIIHALVLRERLGLFERREFAVLHRARFVASGNAADPYAGFTRVLKRVEDSVHYLCASYLGVQFAGERP